MQCDNNKKRIPEAVINKPIAVIEPKKCLGLDLLEAWENAPHLGAKDAETFASDILESRKELLSLKPE